MDDFDQFERRLAAALRSDADLSVGPFEAGSIARAAIAGTQPGATRLPRASSRPPDGSAGAAASPFSRPQPCCSSVGRWRRAPASCGCRPSSRLCLPIVSVVATASPDATSPSPSDSADHRQVRPLRRSRVRRRLDRHRADGHAPLRPHRGAAARWPCARGGRLRWSGRPDLRRAVRPGQRDLVSHREHGPSAGRLPGHVAARWQGAGGRRHRRQHGPPNVRRRAVRPGQGTWTATGSWAPREGSTSTATLLTNGKVLVAGDVGPPTVRPRQWDLDRHGQMVPPSHSTTRPRCCPTAGCSWWAANSASAEGRALRPGHGVVDCHRGYARAPSAP